MSVGNERVSISLGKPATRFGRPSMCGGQASCTALIVAGTYLNAGPVSLRIPKRFTIRYESAFGIRQFASLLQGASG